MLLVKTGYDSDKIVKQIRKNLNEHGAMPVFRVEEIKEPNMIYEKSKSFFDQMPLFLGREHLMTCSTLKAFSEKFKDAGVVILDAHLDLLPGDTVKRIVDEKILRPENIILVGARSIQAAELDEMRKNRIKSYPMREISEEGVREVSDSVMSVAKNFGALYLSIDMDVVDPAFAPGVDDSEPAGLSSRELVYFIHRMKLLRNLKAFDIVRVNPERDVNEMTVDLAAKLVQEMY